MRIFITGTDTNIGKTLVASWLCLHTGYDYVKPIQTGSCEGTDSDTLRHLTQSIIHPETYVYSPPVSPHLAASQAGEEINLSQIHLPLSPCLLIEGAGGVLVPLNRHDLMIDLITYCQAPVILVTSSRLGTINHTLLSVAALRQKHIEILGVIVTGPINQDNCEAIEKYGQVPILAQLPYLPQVNQETLKAVPLSPVLTKLLL
jgi:dethiobiotin synthetase